MVWELTDEALKEFEERLEKSHIDPKLIPYLWELKARNYAAFDRLVMLCLRKDDMAFVYGVGAVLHVDPEGKKYLEDKPDHQPAEYPKCSQCDSPAHFMYLWTSAEWQYACAAHIDQIVGLGQMMGLASVKSSVRIFDWNKWADNLLKK